MRLNRPMTRPLRARAFTSIEVLGVVIIGMILVAVAIVGMRLYEKQLPVRGTAGRLTHAFASARAMAISRNSTFMVVVDRHMNSFWIDETDRFGALLVPKVVAPTSLGEAVTIRNAFPQDAAVLNLRFFPDGSSDDVYIYLELLGAREVNRAGDIVTVRLYGPTGVGEVFERELLPPQFVLTSSQETVAP